MQNLKLKTFILRKFKAKVEILSTIISSGGNLKMTVEILPKTCNFLPLLRVIASFHLNAEL